MANKPAKSALDDDLAVLAAIAFTVFINLCVWSMLSDGDSGWHVATGEWILNHRAIPVVDPFSFTFAGQSWVAHEWLSEVLMAVAWRLGGWGGITLLFAGACAALFLIVGSELRRWLPPLAMFAILLAMFVVLQPFILARPHVLAWPLLAVWMIALVRARARGQAPCWPLALLMVPWANLHGSFLFGLLLVGPFALEALIEAKERRLPMLIDWGRFGLIALISSLATPHGTEGLIFPLQVSTMQSLPMIMEWQATDFEHHSGFELVLLGTLAILLLKGVRMAPLRVLLLLGTLYLALHHIRHQAMLAIIGAILLAEPLARARNQAELPKPRLREALHGLWPNYRRPAALFALLLLAIAAARIAIPMPRPDSRDVPATAMAAMPKELRHQNGFNRYGFGGILILNGFRPFIDGRADLYGDEFMREYDRIANAAPGSFERAVQRWNLRWVMLAPDEPLARKLAKDPLWPLAYRDKWAVLYVISPAEGGAR
jgi:hypothetical protein